jgi:hypothetical protein
MTEPPDLRELIGDEDGPEELARLRRTHQLLVAAGPPAELPPELEQAPPTEQPDRVRYLPRRRPATALGLAAAAVLAALVIGYAVGDRRDEADVDFVVPMHGVAPAASSRGEIEVEELDAAGNWPIVFTVSGLPRLPAGGWYELFLTKKGKIAESCGTFLVEGKGAPTSVRMNVPYRLSNYTGWVVTAHNPHYPGSEEKILLRTDKV